MSGSELDSLNPPPGINPARSKGSEYCDTLRELWGLITDPSWSEPSLLRKQAQLAMSLVRSFRQSPEKKPPRELVLLTKALERIGRGVWPPVQKSRTFLCDCVRALASRLQLPEFWLEEELESLKEESKTVEIQTQKTGEQTQQKVDTQAEKQPAAAQTPGFHADSEERKGEKEEVEEEKFEVEERIVIVLKEEGF